MKELIARLRELNTQSHTWSEESLHDLLRYGRKNSGCWDDVDDGLNLPDETDAKDIIQGLRNLSQLFDHIDAQDRRIAELEVAKEGVTISEAEYYFLTAIAEAADQYINIEHTDEVADSLVYRLWELDSWRKSRDVEQAAENLAECLTKFCGEAKDE